MGHHRQVSQLQVADFVENLHREGQDVAEVRWGECSLRNGFGLKFLHRFFNVPFLTLQRQSLLQQLEVNRRDILATQEELDVYMESDEANYQLFSDSLTSKRRAAAEQAAPPPSASIVAGQPSNTVDLAKTPLTTASSHMSFSNRAAVAPKSPVTAVSPEGKTGSGAAGHAATNGDVTSRVDVDTFIPDEGDFDTFLDEADTTKEKSVMAMNNVDSSDDDEGGNPMVSKFDDEVDVDNYDSVVDIAIARDDSDDSDSERFLSKKKIEKVSVKENTTETVGDNFEDFLNDDECDNSVKSLHTDYETL